MKYNEKKKKNMQYIISKIKKKNKNLIKIKKNKYIYLK